jgi:hypothetical protein
MSALEVGYKLSAFEQAGGAGKPRYAEMVTEDRIAEVVLCGPDAGRHLEALTKHVEAGYTHVAVHQVGPDQEGFFRLYEREVLPALERIRPRRAA